MSKLFLDIFNLSITASWLIVAVLAVRFLFRKRVPKWVNCVMWGIVGLRLLIPFTLESPFSLSVNREVINTDAVYGEAPTDTVPPADDVVVPPANNAGGETQEQPNVDNNTQKPDNTPELSPENTQDKVYIQSGIDVLDDRLNPVINGTVSSVTPSEEPPLRKLVSIASYIWLAGTVILLTYAVINYLLLKYRVSSAIPFANSVRKSERVDTPFVLGFFRPRIYLPFGLSPETEESVVAHENAHIRRNDHIVKPLGYAILAVYWFNPLVWVAYILLCRDIECACDEKVIKNLSAEARKAYATALLECSIRKNYIAACPLAFGEIGVKDRVKNTMRYRRPTFWIIFTAILVCLVVSVLFLTSPGFKENGDTSENVSEDISETESPLIENPATDFEYEINPAQNGILINKYIGTSENVVIPAEIDGLPVVSVRGVSPENSQYAVETGAFDGTNVKTVVVPKSVIAISYRAFKDCKELTSVTFSGDSALTQIGGSAFEGCTSLKEIVLPNTVEKIDSRAFYGCSSLVEMDLPDNLLEIGGSAFTECAALKKISIPAKLDLYFMNMGDSPLTLVPALEQIVFEEGREAIRGYALVNGSLDIKITVPKSVKEFSPYPFFVGRESKTEIVFIGDPPEIVDDENKNFGVSVIYYDPDTSGWDTFAWNGVYEVKPNNESGSTAEVAPPNEGVAVFEIDVTVEDFGQEVSKVPNYVNFIDTTAIGQNWKVSVSVSDNINTFSFIELDESVALKVGKTLYVHSAWKYDEPLMLQTYINDVSSNRGISYVDGEGKVVYMSFFYDIVSGDAGLGEISIGIIPKDAFEPQITDTAYNWENTDIFEDYFTDYIRDENRTSWKHIGVSTGKYNDPAKGYTQFDIYCVEYENGQWVEYYAVPCDGKQIETVYKFQFDDTMVPVWIKP